MAGSDKIITMKSKLREIKLQGLGGQGVVMAVEILAAIMSKAGYHVQSFSQYGAERRGGQVESYLRVSKGQIFTHSRIYEADYLVLASQTLCKAAQILPHIKEGGTLFVNAPRADALTMTEKNCTVVALDADRIAASHGVLLPNGMPVVNTTLVGGLIALFPDIPFALVEEVLKEKGLAAVEKNVAAAAEAYQEVKSPRVNLPRERPGEGSKPAPAKENPVFQTGLSPCEIGCPAGVPVREIIGWLQQGKMHKALRALETENPLPAISGRICFHPCETSCNRKEFDEAVAINALERTVAAQAGMARPVKNASLTKGDAKQVAVIGSGPAGLSCASFLQTLGHRVTVFEALPVAGGLPRIGIPAYRLPRDVVEQQISRIIDRGIELQTGVTVDRPLFRQIRADYDACFVATGAHRPTRLNIPGEEGCEVISGLDFLKRVALGKQARVRAKVGVIGGGNTAIDAARTAKRLGAKEVVIIYRRSPDEMPAYADEVAQAKDEGVSLLCLAAPLGIHSRGARIKHLECVRMALLDRQGKDGRREVAPIPGSAFRVDLDSVIMAVGEGVAAPFLPRGVRKDGPLLEVDTFGRTSLKGLYAGGDLTTFSRSIAHAIGSGKRAAIGIDLFLRGEEAQSAGKEYRSLSDYLAQKAASALDPKVVSLADLNLHYFTKAPKMRPKVLAPETRASHFNEVRGGISKQAAIKEAGRCFHCGTCLSCGNCYIYCPDLAVNFDEALPLPSVNQDVCKACGICINECPHGVIAWERS